MAFTQRSDQTRTAILTAARRRFAADGFERATIRAIAADAGIDPSMVMRYYGSKDGLFAAATDIDLMAPDLGAVPRDQVGQTLVRHFVERWEGSLSDEMLIVLFRSSVTNDIAAERMRTVFGVQVAGALAPVVADPAELPARAGLVSTQLLGVALCRYILCLPPLTGLGADALIANIGPTVQRYLTEPLPR
ncbi:MULTISPECIES: TetR family transcriptional regulator [Thermomonosporaceae]|uniref:TetR/AcrR family transcriptional regulator n=1 Tax=Thermomonosporaceae TaxID=2012 RepID=UPI00255AA0F6|nr:MULTISPECIES: TetR family transcriptional regulator [Thermomonosporaceae]MDL4770970.1 TetR family transcriptional regulator [Actinomadura xylanilytica]